MIGEFLLEVTFLHALIYFIVNLIVLFLIARYKPKWYDTAYRIALLPIVFVFIYKLGWEASATHHGIRYGNQSQLPDFVDGMFAFLMLLHYFFFEKVAEKWVGLEDGETEV